MLEGIVILDARTYILNHHECWSYNELIPVSIGYSNYYKRCGPWWHYFLKLFTALDKFQTKQCIISVQFQSSCYGENSQFFTFIQNSSLLTLWSWMCGVFVFVFFSYQVILQRQIVGILQFNSILALSPWCKLDSVRSHRLRSQSQKTTSSPLEC